MKAHGLLDDVAAELHLLSPQSHVQDVAPPSPEENDIHKSFQMGYSSKVISSRRLGSPSLLGIGLCHLYHDEQGITPRP
jgi:hypothetical protein